MSKTILVTGSRGFIGSNLLASMSSLKPHSFRGDISSFENVSNQINEIKPDIIFHLAAISNISDCEKFPDKAFAINVQGTFNLLESIQKLRKRVRFIFPSTSHVYKPVTGENKEFRIDESFPIGPHTVYGKTKLLCEEAIKAYYLNYQMGQAIVLRLFNHTHYTQNGPFFFPQLRDQILKKQENDTNSELLVGNLNIFRDFSLIPDLLKLFTLSMNSEMHEDLSIFNVCSGNPRKLESLATELSKALKVETKFHVDPSRVRKNEPKLVVGSNVKVRNYLGWEPSELSDQDFIEAYLKPLIF